MFTSKKELEFFCDWYYRAHLDENCDADRQFFYFYALFDHLFKSYAKEHEKYLEEQGLGFKNEKSKMKYFLWNILYSESEEEKFKTFNPFAALKSGNQERLIEKLKIKNDDKLLETFGLPPFPIMMALFTEIYSIRCNLFHGDMDLSDFENNKLIDEANIVLKDFLKRLFDANLFGNK